MSGVPVQVRAAMAEECEQLSAIAPAAQAHCWTNPASALAAQAHDLLTRPSRWPVGPPSCARRAAASPASIN
jgi:hypothetical protein